MIRIAAGADRSLRFAATAFAGFATGLIIAVVSACAFAASVSASAQTAAETPREGNALASAQGIEGVHPLGPAPRGPAGRFTNWAGDLGHGSLGVRFPFMLRRAGGFFRDRPGAPARVAFAAERLRDLAAKHSATVTWIGHATLLVRLGGQTFLTDPTWSETASPIPIGPRRFVPPGLDFDALPPIDFVVVSHNHYDHLDLETLGRLARRSAATRFFVPLGNAALLQSAGISNVTELDWGDAEPVGALVVSCLPAQHWSKRGLGDDLETLWASWSVAGPERRFYFAGDTGYFGGFARIRKQLGAFDLAAMPIGAYAPRPMMKASHLNPEEAYRAAQDLEARRALAMHFGTFDLSDEPLDEPPQRWRAAAASSSAATPVASVASASQHDAEIRPAATRGHTPPPAAPEAWVFSVGETRPF